MTEEELKIIHKDWQYIRGKMRELSSYGPVMEEEDNSERAYYEGYTQGINFVMGYLHDKEWREFKEANRK